MTTPTTHTLTVTTREYALISAALHAAERADRRAGDEREANEARALRHQIATQIIDELAELNSLIARATDPLVLTKALTIPNGDAS